MAGPSDKARFYLEQCVSELNELERKKIFTKDEISSIAQKRSDFEHVINARGSQPSDYQRYIEFEKNVDALRRKRIKRLGVRSTGSGQKTIYFLYNRGVKKFPGDLPLWMQYVEFAEKEKAFKKLNQIFTSVVRLHPTKPEIWIYAARYFIDTQADITNARSYMQRGLRFCKTSDRLWLEYAKLETMYIWKIAGRQKILGLDIDRAHKTMAQEDGDADMIALPVITGEDVNPSLSQEEGADEVALQNLASAPVLTGAIPIAIFDAAMEQFHSDAMLAEQFFDMFADFNRLPCIRRILEHVLQHLGQNHPESVHTVCCKFRLQLFGVDVESSNFIAALRESLELLSSSIKQQPDSTARLAEAAIRRILPLLRSIEDSDEVALKKVLIASLRKYSRHLEEATSDGSGDAIVALVQSLQREKRKSDAEMLVQSMSRQWGTNERLLQLQSSLDT